MKFRKRPVFVEIWAEQFIPGREPWPDGVVAVVESKGGRVTYEGFRWMYGTIEPGDWVVTYDDGCMYVVSDETMSLDYEPVEEP